MNSNPVNDLTAAVFNALYVTLDDVPYETRDWNSPNEKGYVTKLRRPTVTEIEVTMFSQSWPSTALGFGGAGGLAITAAYTVIVRHQQQYVIYFGGRFAYKITNPNPKFFADMQSHTMCAVSEVSNYY
jgi:hypothetical protein